MRILRKASKKAASNNYLAVDEDRDDVVPLRNPSRYVSRGGTSNGEIATNDEASPREHGCDDLLPFAHLYKKHIFQSKKHSKAGAAEAEEIKDGGTFPYAHSDTLAVALACPSSERQPEVKGPRRSCLRKPSITQPSSEETEDFFVHEARDPAAADTGSVTSLFYDDSFTVLDDEQSKQGSKKEESMENTFPDDPSIWMHYISSAEESNDESRDLETNPFETDTIFPRRNTKTIATERSNGLESFLQAGGSPTRKLLSDELFDASSTEDGDTNVESDLSTLETTTTIRNDVGPNHFDADTSDVSTLETTTTVRNEIGPKTNINPFEDSDDEHTEDDYDDASIKKKENNPFQGSHDDFDNDIGNNDYHSMQKKKNPFVSSDDEKDDDDDGGGGGGGGGGGDEVEELQKERNPFDSSQDEAMLKDRNPFDSSHDEGDEDYYNQEPVSKENTMSMDEVKVIANLMSVSGGHRSPSFRVAQTASPDDSKSCSSGRVSANSREVQPNDTASEASSADNCSTSNSDRFVQAKNTLLHPNGAFPRKPLDSSREVESNPTQDSSDNSTYADMHNCDSNDEEASLEATTPIVEEKRNVIMKTYSDEDVYYDGSSSEEIDVDAVTMENDATKNNDFNIKIHPASQTGSDDNKLGVFEQEADDSSVEGSEATSDCKKCCALEEEIMILQAQHQTELLERDLQDEEIMKNMILMKEYIEDLESDNLLITDQLELTQQPQEEPEAKPKMVSVHPTTKRIKSEMEEKLLMFDEELDYRGSSFKLDLLARLKETQEENDRLSAALTKNDKRIEDDKKELQARIEALQSDNESLSAELANAKDQKEQIDDDLEARLNELESENDRLSAALSQGSNLSEKDEHDLKTRIILELEEELDMLKTKIQAQQASVELMTEEEEQLKLKMRALEQEVKYVQSNGNTTEESLHKSCSGGSGSSTSVGIKETAETHDKTMIKELQDELEKSKSVCLCQEETISKLVQQVKELSAMGANEILLQADTKLPEFVAEDASAVEPSADDKSLQAKIQALELERNQLRSKCIFQQRTISKMQHSSGSFLMPPIFEHKEFDPKETLREGNSNGSIEEEIFEETEAEKKLKTVTDRRKKKLEVDIHLKEESRDDNLDVAHLKYLEEIIRSMSDSDGSNQSDQADSHEGEPCEEEEEEEEPTGRAARWKETLRRKSAELTTTILSAGKKSKEEEEPKRGDGIFC